MSVISIITMLGICNVKNNLADLFSRPICMRRHEDNLTITKGYHEQYWP